MQIRRSSILVAILAFAAAFPAAGRSHDSDRRPSAVQDAVVHFGQQQPQSTPGAVTHLLDPDDVTIHKGGTVTFVVNGGGHGIAIHPVDRDTTRDDVARDLCQGGTNEADRLGRSAVCNNTIVVGAITGTQNLAYQVTDADHRLIINVPQNVANANPRVDDPDDRMLATSGAVAADANPAGAFLVGTLPNPAAPPAFTPGNRIQVRFEEKGRFLVICMNRGHALNDHMFGFVSVVDDDDDDDHRGRH
jgi:plastocyanin